MSGLLSTRLCRLCLHDKNSYVVIYETNEKYGFIVADVLNELLELDVSPKDGLPGCICNDCLDEVARFKRFKITCHESKRKLKYVIMQNKEIVSEPSNMDQRLTIDYQNYYEIKREPVDETSSSSRFMPEGLLDPVYNMIDNHSARISVSAHDYLENLPSGYTSLMDANGKQTVEPFEAVDCVVGAFGFELENRAMRNIGSARMQHPSILESRRIKLEDDQRNLNETFRGSTTESKYRHRCSICAKLFGDESSLRSHVDSKGCAVPMLCKFCPKTFYGKRRLQKHVYNCHRSDSLYQCEVCQRKFAKKDHLNRHMLTHSSDRPYGCSECHKRYKWKMQLERHLFNYHKIRRRERHGCDSCGKMFVKKESLETHVCTAPRLFVCDLCGMSYKHKHEVKQHIWRLHLNHLPHKCSLCGKDFATISELNQHGVVHSKERPFSCQKCGHGFKTKRHLKQHATMCLVECKIRGCYVCGETFCSEIELSEHKRLHSREEEGRFSCKMCENTYKKSSYLKQHVRRCHLVDKSYGCEACGKMFAVKSDLRQHSMVHSDARPFVCGLCGNGYKHKQALQRHTLTAHTEQDLQILYLE